MFGIRETNMDTNKDNKISVSIKDIDTTNLTPYRVEYEEGISKPYKCNLYFVDNGKTTIKYIQELCGQNITVTMQQFISLEETKKTIYGIITNSSIVKVWEEKVSGKSTGNIFKEIKIVIEPPLVLLKETVRTATYRNMSISELIESIFAKYEKRHDFQISESILNTAKNLDMSKTMVHNQIEETDFDFFNRVLAYYGYNYIFLPIVKDDIYTPTILITDKLSRINNSKDIKVYDVNFMHYKIDADILKIKNLSTDTSFFRENSQGYAYLSNFDYNKTNKEFEKVYEQSKETTKYAYKASLKTMVFETEYIGAEAGEYIKVDDGTKYLMQDIYIDFYATKDFRHVYGNENVICIVKYNTFEYSSDTNLFSLIQINSFSNLPSFRLGRSGVSTQLFSAIVCDSSGDAAKSIAAFGIENNEENPMGFYALLEDRENTIVYVNHTMPLGGHKNGLFRFPITGDRILVNYSNGKYYLDSYLTPDNDYYNFLSDVTGRELQGSIILRYFNENNEYSGISIIDSYEIDRIASFIASNRIDNVMKQYSSLIGYPSLYNNFQLKHKNECDMKYNELVTELENFKTDASAENKQKLKNTRDKIRNLAKDIIELLGEYNINAKIDMDSIEKISKAIKNNSIKTLKISSELKKMTFGVEKKLNLEEYVELLSKYQASAKRKQKQSSEEYKKDMSADEKAIVNLSDVEYDAKVNELASAIRDGLTKANRTTTIDITSSGDITMKTEEDMFMDSKSGIYISGKDVKMTATQDMIELNAEKSIVLRVGRSSISITDEGIQLASHLLDNADMDFDSVINVSRDMGVSIQGQYCNLKGLFTSSFLDITGSGFSSIYGYSSLIGNDVSIENRTRIKQYLQLKDLAVNIAQFIFKNGDKPEEPSVKWYKELFFGSVGFIQMLAEQIDSLMLLIDGVTGNTKDWVKILSMVSQLVCDVYTISVNIARERLKVNKIDDKTDRSLTLALIYFRFMQLFSIIISTVTMRLKYNKSLIANLSGKITVSPELIDIASDAIEITSRERKEKICFSGDLGV